MEDCSIDQSVVVWVRKPNFGSFCCGQPFVHQVWLSSGPPECFTFSYCAWLWNWLTSDIHESMVILSYGTQVWWQLPQLRRKSAKLLWTRIITCSIGCETGLTSQASFFEGSLLSLPRSCRHFAWWRHLTTTTRMHFSAIFVMQICVTHERFFLKEALSVLMLCAPLFMFTSRSSALLGRPRCCLSIWLSLHNQYTFLSLCQHFSRKNPGQNTKNSPFSYDTKMTADGSGRAKH